VPLSRYDVILAVAHALKSKHQRDIAVLIGKGGCLGVGVCECSGRYDYATCIVNALQNACEKHNLSKVNIYTTVAPKDVCLGMAQMSKVNSVYFRENDQLYGQKPDSVKKVQHIAAGDKTKIGDIQYWKSSTDLDPLMHSLIHDATWGQQVTEIMSEPLLRRVPAQKFPTPPPPKALIGKTSIMQKEEIYMLTAYAMVEFFWNRSRAGSVHMGHNIGSILVDDKGAVVSWALNTNKDNLTRHGEVNIIKQYLESNVVVPSGFKLFSTLEPCHMCAAFIANSGDNVEVIYGQVDHAISNTSLDRKVNGCTSRVMKPFVYPFSHGDRLFDVQRKMSAGPMMQTIRFLEGAQAWHSFENASESLVNMRRKLTDFTDVELWEHAVELMQFWQMESLQRMYH